MFHFSSLCFLGNLGSQEIFIIFLMVLLLFGAKKLPELARGIGKSLGEFKRAKTEFEKELLDAEEDSITKKPQGQEESKKEEV